MYLNIGEGEFICQYFSLLQGDWKTYRGLFGNLSVDSRDGWLSFPEFRSVLKFYSFLLSGDEVYHVLSKYDWGLYGKIDYRFVWKKLANHGKHLMPKKPPSGAT